MSSSRREKIDSFRFDKDKRLSLGAGILTFNMLEKAELDPFTPINISENGKPYLPYDCGIYFNISHSKAIVMCTVSDKETGCDIEKTEKEERGITKRYFSKEENIFLDSISDQTERNRMFYRIWTLKESFVKNTGKGIFSGFPDFSVIPKGNGIYLKTQTEDDLFTFNEFFNFDGYACSCCIRGEKPENGFTFEELKLPF